MALHRALDSRSLKAVADARRARTVDLADLE
jgi:hypothetical protein